MHPPDLCARPSVVEGSFLQHGLSEKGYTSYLGSCTQSVGQAPKLMILHLLPESKQTMPVVGKCYGVPLAVFDVGFSAHAVHSLLWAVGASSE